MPTGNDKIGEGGYIENIYLETQDALETEYHTNITKNFGINYEVTYSQLDQITRAINNLTTNRYRDTTIIKSVSVNEILNT